ncbi:MAG: adenosylcobinamide-GDP ribazoletransferase [Mariprofundaceae bacterium]|nr:adenosylcobinamide-GDP ribazoletransferase [Mariprofundaceae bacterium]
MIPQGLIEALRWMTVIPMPQQKKQMNMTNILPWLPVTGLVVGLCVSSAAWLGMQYDVWLGACLAVFVWLAITGFLHADGLADLSDALGASHGDKHRFLAVLKDPHIGSFGVMSLILLVIAKLILLKILLSHGVLWSVMLIPIWARVGVFFWLQLPALTQGFAAAIQGVSITSQAMLWCIILTVVSFFLPAHVWFSPFVLWFWYLFLQRRLRGMNGDCLGAGIEVSEVVLLLLFL